MKTRTGHERGTTWQQSLCLSSPSAVSEYFQVFFFEKGSTLVLLLQRKDSRPGEVPRGKERALAALSDHRGPQRTELTFLQGCGHLSLDMRPLCKSG